jgi:hypothetical protein
VVSAFGLYLIRWMTEIPAPIVGVGFVLTAGAGMLLIDLLFDKFDVLADPNEYQVIAAHPHDAWSVVLAKVMAIGRDAAILAACLFAVPAITAGFVFHSAVAAIAFVLAAAALTVAVSAGGMLSSAAVVALGGKNALQRLLPLMHLIYLALYLGIMTGSRWIASIAPSGIEAMGWLKWALPSIWFVAPVEIAAGRFGATTIVRGLLALGTLLITIPLFTRWLRTRFDERMLETPTRRTRSTAGRGVTARDRSVPASWQIGPRTFWKLLQVHLSSDAAVRGGMMAAFFMPILMFVSTQTSRAQVRAHIEFPIAMMTVWFGAAMSLLARTLQLSSRPQALWFILIAPESRVDFSRSVVWALRLAVLLPLTIAAVIYASITEQGLLWSRLLFVALAIILCDAMLVATRGFSPAVPFSKSVKEKDRVRWGSVVAYLGLLAVQSLALIAFVLLSRINPIAGLIPMVYAILLRIAVGWWAGRRVVANALAAEGIW